MRWLAEEFSIFIGWSEVLQLRRQRFVGSRYLLYSSFINAHGDWLIIASCFVCVKTSRSSVRFCCNSLHYELILFSWSFARFGSEVFAYNGLRLGQAVSVITGFVPRLMPKELSLFQDLMLGEIASSWEVSGFMELIIYNWGVWIFVLNSHDPMQSI